MSTNADDALVDDELDDDDDLDIDDELDDDLDDVDDDDDDDELDGDGDDEADDDDELDGDGDDEADDDDDELSDEDFDDDFDDEDDYDDDEALAPRATAVVTHLARSLVEDPDAVQVHAEQLRNGKVRLSVLVGPSDRGRIIGRRGRVASLVRSVVAAASHRDGVHVEVDFTD